MRTSHLVWLQVRSLINAQLVGAVSATTTCWRYTCDYIQVKRTSNARSVVPSLQSVVPLCLISELTQVWSHLFAPSVVASLHRVQPWRDIFVSTPRFVQSTHASTVFRFVMPCSMVDMDWCSLGKYLCSIDTYKPDYMVSIIMDNMFTRVTLGHLNSVCTVMILTHLSLKILLNPILSSL